MIEDEGHFVNQGNISVLSPRRSRHGENSFKSQRNLNASENSLENSA